jgi:hypothetical protein
MNLGDLVDLDDWENESSIYLTTTYSSQNIKWYNGEIGIIIGIRSSDSRMKIARILLSEGVGEIYTEFIKKV